MASKKPVLFITGPTGVGKTALALSFIKQRLEGQAQIISCDSVQVYRGLDIGSAKPTARQRAQVVHHCIDVTSPQDDYSVAHFRHEASRALQACHDSGQHALVVGGAGFYADALTLGLPDTPPSDAKVKEDVRRQLDELGSWEKGLAWLREVDRTAADRLQANDTYRLQRALEIAILSGGSNPNTDASRVQDDLWGEADVRKIFLAPRSRIPLYRRIDERCERMVIQGLLAEVKALVDTQQLLPDTNAGRAIGYRQGMEFVRWLATKGDQASMKSLHSRFDRFLAAFQSATRQYARNQFTWTRRAATSEHPPLWIYEDEVDNDLLHTLVTEPRQSFQRRVQLQNQDPGRPALNLDASADAQTQLKQYASSRVLLTPPLVTQVLETIM